MLSSWNELSDQLKFRAKELDKLFRTSEAPTRCCIFDPERLRLDGCVSVVLDHPENKYYRGRRICSTGQRVESEELSQSGLRVSLTFSSDGTALLDKNGKVLSPTQALDRLLHGFLSVTELVVLYLTVHRRPIRNLYPICTEDQILIQQELGIGMISTSPFVELCNSGLEGDRRCQVIDWLSRYGRPERESVQLDDAVRHFMPNADKTEIDGTKAAILVNWQARVKATRKLYEL